MPEIHNEKTNTQRSDYSRNFMKVRGIEGAELTSLAKLVNVEIQETDIQNDDTLYGKIKEIQKNLGFPEKDSKEGQDGILGPRTLAALEKKNKEEKNKDSTRRMAEDLKTEINNSGDTPNQPETPTRIIDVILNNYPGNYITRRMSGNGNRLVGIYIPKNFDPHKPVEIAYHFHGTHSHLIDTPLPYLNGGGERYNSKKAGTISVGSDRLNQAISTVENQVKSGARNAILVYPLSAGQRSGGNRIARENGYDHEWMKTGNNTKDNMQKLHQEAMESVKDRIGFSFSDNPTITLSGHSAGGAALANILESGFHADKVKFLDASYGSWAKKAHEAIEKQGQKTVLEIYARPGAKTDNAETQSVKGGQNVSYVLDNRTHDNFITYHI